MKIKLSSKILFLLFFCFISCFFESEDCEDTINGYLTEDEMLFVPYRINDSILFKDNAGKSYFFSVKENDICNPCSIFIDDNYCKNGGYYSFWHSVSVSLDSNIPVLKNESLTIDIWFGSGVNDENENFGYLLLPSELIDFDASIGKEYDGIIFMNREYRYNSDSNKLEYQYHNSFYNPDPQVLYFPSYYLDDREFKNTFAIIESEQYSFFDTILYTPEYGFIKFIDDTLSYSYINKYER